MTYIWILVGFIAKDVWRSTIHVCRWTHGRLRSKLSA